VDGMLAFNGQAVLTNSGSISHEDMVSIAHARYETFDHNRRATEAQEADAADLQEIERLEKRVATAKTRLTTKATRGKKE